MILLVFMRVPLFLFTLAVAAPIVEMTGHGNAWKYGSGGGMSILIPVKNCLLDNYYEIYFVTSKEETI